MIAAPFVSRAIMYTAFAAALAGAVVAPHTHVAANAPHLPTVQGASAMTVGAPAQTIDQRG